MRTLRSSLFLKNAVQGTRDSKPVALERGDCYSKETETSERRPFTSSHSASPPPLPTTTPHHRHPPLPPLPLLPAIPQQPPLPPPQPTFSQVLSSSTSALPPSVHPRTSTLSSQANSQPLYGFLEDSSICNSCYST